MEFEAKNGVVLIDTEDLVLVSEYCWTIYKYSKRGLYYANAFSGGKTLYMHRLIIDAQKGEYVDHEDGNGLNNQKYNLRRTTQSVNIANAKKYGNGKSGYRGVVKYRDGWKAQFKFNQKLIQSNEIADPYRAALLRDAIVRQLYTEPVTLNFPDIRDDRAVEEATRLIKNQARV